MNNSVKSISHKSGLPPGALIHIGRKKTDKVKISVIDYNKTIFEEKECQSLEDCFPFRDTDTISWINVDGLHDIDSIAKLGEHFSLHPLLLEDVLNTRHRPKLEEFENCLFLTLKMLGIGENGKTIISEQVSFVLGPNWLISFQEQEGDIFEAIRQRLREGRMQIRQRGVDYLLYRLLDTVVDNYFLVIENVGEIAEELEEEVLNNPDNTSLQDIQRLKKQLINLRRSIYPLREAILVIQRDETDFINSETTRYLSDVYEHIIQISDSIDMHRDIVASIMDLYLSGVSNKMNQVMQVLTIISTIFIPMTFIAGIYGMNFDHMPELHWKYGYFGIWGLMGVMALGLIFFFRRKRWL